MVDALCRPTPVLTQFTTFSFRSKQIWLCRRRGIPKVIVRDASTFYRM